MNTLILCVISSASLLLCVLVLILTSFHERCTCQNGWNKLTGQMELAVHESSFQLKCNEIIIGRHASADIRLPDLSVSRYHAILIMINGVWIITDIGSKSGVFVNGVLVKQRRLYANDVITLGNQKLIFRHRRNKNAD